MVKAVVAGASGGIGQPLSLLFKTSSLIDELALYDVVGTPGVGADLSHIQTHVKTTAYLPAGDGPELAFTGADIVVVPAGIPRKPGMTRDDLFNTNAGIVKGLTEMVAKYAPNAFLLIISNPVNSMVPVAAEALKAKGVFNPKHLFGVTTLDIVRARTFVAELAGIGNPLDVNVPVIGGHSGHTIIPVLSQAKPSVKVHLDKILHDNGPYFFKPVVVRLEEGKEVKILDKGERGHPSIIERIQYGGDEVVNAKAGAGSATLSMAYAGFTFAQKVLQAAKGEKGIVECTYVYLPGIPGGDVIAKETGCDYFSVPVELGTNGAEKAVNILPDLDANEKELLRKCLEGFTKEFPVEKVDENGEVLVKPETAFQAGLKVNIAKGVDFKPVPKPEK